MDVTKLDLAAAVGHAPSAPSVASFESVEIGVYKDCLSEIEFLRNAVNIKRWLCVHSAHLLHMFARAKYTCVCGVTGLCFTDACWQGYLLRVVLSN